MAQYIYDGLKAIPLESLPESAWTVLGASGDDDLEKIGWKKTMIEKEVPFVPISGWMSRYCSSSPNGMGGCSRAISASRS